MKTVGDGVLFTAGTGVAAVNIGLDLPEAWEAEDRPPLRTGAAYGPVLTRLGDIYSPVVNMASRLTSLARPSTVLVDRELAQQLRGNPAYRVRPLRRCRCAATTTCSPGWCGAGPREDDNPFEGMLDELTDDVLDRPEDDEDEGTHARAEGP